MVTIPVMAYRMIMASEVEAPPPPLLLLLVEEGEGVPDCKPPTVKLAAAMTAPR